MLQQMAKGLVLRIAAGLAALAVLGFVVPPMALAFAETGSATNCIVGAHKVMTGDHGQHRSTPQAHHALSTIDSSGQKPSDHTTDELTGCCGLFCFTTLMPAIAEERDRQLVRSILSLPLHSDLFGRTPDFPDRPPRISLTI